jgi:hypothetical protein
MDTVGAFFGPMLAMLMMAATGDDFRFAFWTAVIPAALAVLLIVYGVQEPAAPVPRLIALLAGSSRLMFSTALLLLGRVVN